MTPTIVFDNSLITATGEMENLTRAVRWRPGLCAIHEIEENIFYTELNLKGREFRSVDEVNDYIRRLTEGGRPIPRVKPKTPFERARALVYQTIDAPKKKRVEKCREALSVYPHCADALLILSEYENDPEAKREMLRQAVDAGWRSLKDLGIDCDEGGRHPRPKRRNSPQTGSSGGGEERKGALWAGPGRPYLRAKAALAQHLYQMGERDQAIEDYRDLMDLDPLDHQGVRHLLVSALLEKGAHGVCESSAVRSPRPVSIAEEGAHAYIREAAAMVASIRDISPMWAWAKAFVEYLEHTDDKPAASGRPSISTGFLPMSLVRAYYGNPHIAEVLLGKLDVPVKLPETSEYGSEEEAVIYGSLAGRYWRANPGALEWLAGAVARITGGLPVPFSGNEPSVRERIARLWRSYGPTMAEVPPQDRHYAKAMRDHREFGPIWLTANAPGAESLVVSGISPFEHIGLQAAVESVLSGTGEVHDAMTAALDAATQAGLYRHEAIHLLSYIYAFDWVVAESDASPLDLEMLTSHFRYVARLASGAISPNVALTAPARNDPCPCGSGKKFKKCCGRNDSWPIPPVVDLAHAIKHGQGRVRSHRDLETVTHVLGCGHYAHIDKLAELPPEHPLVAMENRSAVAEVLWERGWQFQAQWALRDNIEVARTLEDTRHLKTALDDALRILSKAAGFEPYVCQYACELARMTEEPGEASRLWAIAGEIFIDGGKIVEAGEATERAISVKTPHPKAKYVRAKYLAEIGQTDAARAAYEDVLRTCSSSIGHEYEELAVEAEEEIRKLGKRRQKR